MVLFPEVEVTDYDGNTIRRPAATGIEVRTHVQRVSAAEAEALGGMPATTVRFRTSRALPVGAYAHAEFKGRRWDVVGEPVRLGRSERTASTVVVLRARQAAPLEGGA